MEKESNIYYHKYLKYKNKYLQAKKFLGGAEKTPGREPYNSMPPKGLTNEPGVYSYFYNSFTPEVIECIRVNAPLSPDAQPIGGCGRRIIIDTGSKSGIYFKFNDTNKISVHTDQGNPNKIHIYQTNTGIYGEFIKIINFSLAIEYDSGNLILIRRGNLRNKIDQSWLEIRQEFKDLLTLIERCINDANTSKMNNIKLDLIFEGEEGTGVAYEKPKAAGAGP
jgi:hypothetical protein